MTVQYKTPGVYIEEIDAFPPSIVGVETAVPVFIGYTEKAEYKGRSATLQPVRITSMADYAPIFGGYEPRFTLADAGVAKPAVTLGGKPYTLTLARPRCFYNSLRLFYANGGGSCYVVSVGDYADNVTAAALEVGLAAVQDLVGPTMLVLPEAPLLDQGAFASLVNKMLAQCQLKQDRVAVLDVWGVDKLPFEAPATEFAARIAEFRAGLAALSASALRYGTAYTPFLKTSIVDPSELDFTNIATLDVLIAALNDEAMLLGLDSKRKTKLQADYLNKMPDIAGMPPSEKRAKEAREVDQGMRAQLPALKDLYTAMATALGRLPPSAAMAGVYTQIDALRGVWNAPANVGLASVIGPTFPVSNAMQSDLNMPIDGLAINAIRDFVGRGTLVWGARTLDGNSNDWRYIQVRRALIYIEQSVKLALEKFVFEPNVAQTWVTVNSMISSFLRGMWRAGGLMGASPQEAFSVQCGLGSTMTAQDVLENRMIVQIRLQMVHPAEFVVLTLEQQMQGGAG